MLRSVRYEWYKQWCRSKVVGGRRVPQGRLQGNSHNALGCCEKALKRFSEGKPEAVGLPEENLEGAF